MTTENISNDWLKMCCYLEKPDSLIVQQSDFNIPDLVNVQQA